MRGNVRDSRSQSSPVVQSAATTTATRAQPPPLSTNERRESWGPAVIGGEAWGWVTSRHGGSLHCRTCCSVFRLERDLVPNLLNITSIRFGQVSYRPDYPAAAYEQTTRHTKLLTKLLRNEFQPNFCNYQHSVAKAVARELDFYVGVGLLVS